MKEWFNKWDTPPDDEERVLISHYGRVYTAECSHMNDGKLEIKFYVKELGLISNSMYWMKLPEAVDED